MPARRTTILAASLTAAGLLLTACGGSSDSDSGSAGSSGDAAEASAPAGHEVVDEAAALLPADVKEKGTLVVATGEGYPPFEFYAEDNKTLVGVDPEIITAVAGALGLEVDLQVLKFDAIIPGLQGGRYDVGDAAMGITAERNEVVDFVSYFEGGTSIMTPAGNPEDLTLDTLCGHTIAAQKGSIYADEYLPDFDAACTAAGEDPITVDIYPDQPQATLAVSSGRAEATMSDFGPLAYVAQQSNGKFDVLDANYEPAPYGIALAKGSELAPAIEAALQALIDDGTYAEILEKWDVDAGAIEDPEVSRG